MDNAIRSMYICQHVYGFRPESGRSSPEGLSRSDADSDSRTARGWRNLRVPHSRELAVVSTARLATPGISQTSRSRRSSEGWLLGSLPDRAAPRRRNTNAARRGLSLRGAPLDGCERRQAAREEDGMLRQGAAGAQLPMLRNVCIVGGIGLGRAAVAADSHDGLSPGQRPRREVSLDGACSGRGSDFPLWTLWILARNSTQ